MYIFNICKCFRAFNVFMPKFWLYRAMKAARERVAQFTVYLKVRKRKLTWDCPMHHQSQATKAIVHRFKSLHYVLKKASFAIKMADNIKKGSNLSRSLGRRSYVSCIKIVAMKHTDQTNEWETARKYTVSSGKHLKVKTTKKRKLCQL
jgi:hypothetical protein